MIASDKSLLSNADLQELFNVSERTIHVWVATGKIPPPLRVSRRTVRWRRAEIEALIEQKQTG